MNLGIAGAYIAGSWVTGTGVGMVEVVNPATEEVLTRFRPAGADQVELAVRQARAAFEGWSRTPVAERASVLTRAAKDLEARRDQVADLIVADVGTPIRMATRVQVQLPITVLNSVAELAEASLQDERIGNSVVVREAVGVVAAITPWNYPLHQVVSKIAPALAAGAAVVLKPSEVAPLSVVALLEALEAAGLPAGVLNVVNGVGPDIGPVLVAHDEVDMVSFTGSTAAGSVVAALAGQGIKRVTLELGGKSANILLEDADFEKALKVGVANAMLNGGQTCSAWTRILVPRARHDEALEAVAAAAGGFGCGDPTDPATRLGPMVSAAQRDRVRSFIRRGIAEGSRLAAGGPDAPPSRSVGFFVEATVFGGVDPDSVIAQQEIFGPVVCVIPYDDDDAAIAIANNSPYGLHGAVWSSDVDRAIAVARRLRTGSVDINGAAHNPLAPFGGFRKSGVGRELGKFGIEEFTELKAIQL